MKTRGYTLIEIAIVLVVALMLSSLLLTNYYSHQKNARNSEAERHLAQIKEAVVNYAATHTTAQRFFDVVNLSITTLVTVRHTIPAGRPYLPCPDIDGDGYEDRIPPSPADTPLRLMLNFAANPNYSPFSYPLEMSGGCASSRGIVPWRTLDSPPVDPWGNRYSYRVAGIYSNVLTGFDQQAAAGANYAVRPLMPDGENARVLEGVNMSFFDLQLTFPADSGPWNAFGLFNYLAPAFVCNAAPCPPTSTAIIPAGVTVSIVAGELATASVTVFYENLADFDGAAEARLVAGDAISGVPFVVLSHGENGYGGVRADTPGYVCNPFPGPDTRWRDERQNSIWLLGVPVNAGDFRYDCPLTTPDVPLQEPGFVAGINSGVRAYDRREETGRGSYDDLVDWMSMEELVDVLSERGTLPARLPPPIGMEQ